MNTRYAPEQVSRNAAIVGHALWPTENGYRKPEYLESAGSELFGAMLMAQGQDQIWLRYLRESVRALRRAAMEVRS